jgi:DNA helicase-2/ATP-dependent DNA helicase PcrA
VQALLAQDLPVTEIAVLHRYHVQGVPIRAALLGTGIPVVRLKDDEKFFQTAAVRTALQALRRTDADADGAAALERALRQQGFDAEQPPSEGLQLDRHEVMSTLLQLVRALPPERRVTSGSLLVELESQARQERDPTHTLGVTVGTIHAAKGLEWDAVLLPRMTDGSLPASFARAPHQQAEERRLFYVAVTRARRHLHLSRAERSDGRTNRPSPFLDALRPPPVTPSVGQPIGSSKGGRAASRSSVSRPPTPPPWKVGERVLHDTYGMGKVLSHVPGAAVVDFGGNYGKRQIKSTTRKMARLP